MKDVEKIMVHYEDGTTKDIEKGVVFTMQDTGHGECSITAEMVNIAGRDLYTIVSGVIEMAYKIGMFNDDGGAEE
jgi:hypothetical protein